MDEYRIQYNVPVTNSWIILGEDECEEMEPKKPTDTQKTSDKTNDKNKKPPPIVITMVITEYKAFNSEVKEIVGTEDYTISYSTKASRIFLNDEETYEQVRKALKQDRVAFHLYTKSEIRTKQSSYKSSPEHEHGRNKK